MEFFEHFLNPFQECDVDKSHGLNDAELKDCILNENKLFHSIHSVATEEDEVNKLMLILDCEQLNLYDYIYLRRVQNAVAGCAENDKIMPNKIACAT